MKTCCSILILFLVCSCIRDKPQELLKIAANIDPDKKVLITNEGNFGWGIGTVSLYDPTSGSVIENYDQQQNGGSTLGNVCQSITKYNSKYYVVMNNSNKVVVLNSSDFIKTSTISGFNSPRYLLPITYNKAYVSDLYANSIQIVDLNTNTITGNIPCKSATDEMVMIYNKAFVINGSSDYCYVINTATDVIIDSINVGKGGSSVIVDKNAKIWILTSGNTAQGQNGKLLRIDPINLQIEQNLNFNPGDSPYKLCVNKTRDTLYYLNNGVFQYMINSVNLPSNPLISQGSKLYYGLGVNPKDYTIYVADAIDYVQKSKIEIYYPNGSFKTSFNAGIISNGFMFE